MTKNGWNDWIFHSIDCDAQAKALNTLQYTQELFVTKWDHHNLLPTRRHTCNASARPSQIYVRHASRQSKLRLISSPARYEFNDKPPS